MPRTKAKSGYGSKVLIELTPGSGVYDDIGEISSDVAGLGSQPEFVDATNMGSPGGVEEKIPSGVTTLPNLTFDLNLITPSDPKHRLLLDAVEAKTLLNFRVTLGANASQRLSGAGYAVVDTTLPMRGPMKQAYSITRSGPWVTEAHS